LGSQKAPAITIWYGRTQRLGHCGRPQRWVSVLGRASEPEQVRSLLQGLTKLEHLEVFQCRVTAKDNWREAVELRPKRTQYKYARGDVVLCSLTKAYVSRPGE